MKIKPNSTGRRASSWQTSIRLLAIVAGCCSSGTSVVAQDAEKSNVEIEHDRFGRMTSEIHSNDASQKYKEINYEYDEKGRIARKTVTSFDESTGSVKSTEVCRFTHNEQGNVTSESLEYDSDADGKPDSRTETTFEHVDNLMSRKKIQSDTNADGEIDATEVVDFAYTQDGKLLRETIERDHNSNGTVDFRLVSEFEYSGNSMRKKSIQTDNDADGTFDSKEEVVFSTGLGGHVTREVHSIDSDNDGVNDDTRTVERTIHFGQEKKKWGGTLITVNIVMMALAVTAFLFVKMRKRT